MASLTPVVCIHGISEKRNARGFSGPMRRGVEALARKHRLKPPAWRECIWSDLSDLGGGGVTDVADLALDVLRYAHDAELRLHTQARLRSMVLDVGPCVIVAHSLGSVIAFDALCNMRPGAALALVTMGSPLALEGPALDYRERAALADLGALRGLDWMDIYSDHDPVATGSIGALEVLAGARGLEQAGYQCTSARVDNGTHPIIAHTNYWRHPIVWRMVLAAASNRG